MGRGYYGVRLLGDVESFPTTIVRPYRYFKPRLLLYSRKLHGILLFRRPIIKDYDERGRRKTVGGQLVWPRLGINGWKALERILKNRLSADPPEAGRPTFPTVSFGVFGNPGVRPAVARGSAILSGQATRQHMEHSFYSIFPQQAVGYPVPATYCSGGHFTLP